MKVFTVSGLNNYIKSMIDDEVYLEGITLKGEISSLSVSGSNAYFCLCDASASISCMCFNSVIKALDGSAASFKYKTGDRVDAVGSLSFYQKTGKLSFIVKELTLSGEGDKQRAFLQLKEFLNTQGVFSKKRAMPEGVQRIAVVTSADGAALQDIKSVAFRRNRAIDITVFPARVQGAGAEKEICSALALADKGGFQLIILARGGGSEDDLAAFNTEVAARAVFACNTVTVSAVGHEINYTLCDFAADFRAATPSAAAEIAVPLFSDRVNQLQELAARIGQGVNALIMGADRRLLQGANRVAIAASSKIADCKASCFTAEARVQGAASRFFTTRENAVNQISARIRGLNPTALISMGYAKLYSGGTAVSDISTIKEGDQLDIYMQGGQITASVTGLKKN